MTPSTSFLVRIILLCTLSIHSQEVKSKAVSPEHVKRFFKVSENLFRSSQPSKKGFIELEKKGIQTVINLRRLKDDKRKARHTNLILEHIRLKTKEINENDIFEVLKAIQKAKKPILIHCWHGSDRTGVVTAAYRVIYENWTKEQAIEEFRQAKFGYHEKWYPNLLTLISNLNVQKIRTDLKL